MRSEQKQKKEKKPFPFKKLFFILLAIFLIIAGFLLYSRFIGTTGLMVKEYKVATSTLPQSFHGIKIVQLSDIHYGRTVKTKELKKIVDQINYLNPDLVVLSGDLIDKDTVLSKDMINDLTTQLKKITSTIGKYAITGNHDYAFKEWNNIIENSGFHNLNDTYDVLYYHSYEPILIAGMSTNLYGVKSVSDKLKDVKDYLSSFTTKPTSPGTAPSSPTTEQKKEPKYKILLFHEPDFIDKVEGVSFDLALAGHSHNGQVRLPFIGAIVTPPGAKTYYKEHYTVNDQELYISSGIGTSTINFRFFNRPSINLYRLVKE